MDATGRAPRSTSGERAQVDEALKWTIRSLADDFAEVEGGWVATSRRLPLVHSVNRLQVTASMDPKDVLALADADLGNLPYRHIEVDDAPTAAALEHALATPGSGWKTDREVLMVLDDDRSSGRAADDVPVDPIVELSTEEMDDLMRRWLIEEHADTVSGALEQLSVCNLREGELWGEVVFGVREEGRPVALTKSRAHGEVGWVEDVYTVPGSRRKGYARLLVARAVSVARQAGPALTFIIADDNDWPKHLYAELGFRPVGHTWTFHRELGG